jgi:hypothetical protein
MPISASEYAAMTYAAYGFAKGEEPLAKLGRFDDRLDPSAYKVLTSKKEYTVFSKISSGEVVLAIKGTSQASDWGSNFLISVGSLDSDPRMFELINVVRKYKRAGVDITVTGHSLGGALAAYLAKNEDVVGVTFNAGSFLAESTAVSQADSVLRKEKSENVIQFNTGVDPLSFAGARVNPQGKSVTFFVGSTDSNPHAMMNFQGLDDTVYQPEIDGRVSEARLYRTANPKEKTRDYTRWEQLEQTVKNIKKLIDTYEEIRNWYDLTNALVKYRDQIPANLMNKWNSFKSDVGAVYRSMNRLNQARAEGDWEGVVDAGKELAGNASRLNQHGTFERFIKDMSADNVGVEGSLGDAINAIQDSDPPLDPEFDGFDEMEVYDENDGLDPVDDGEGLGFDEDRVGGDLYDEAGEDVPGLDPVDDGEGLGFAEDGLDVEEGLMAGDEGVGFLTEGAELEIASLAAAEVEAVSASMLTSTALGIAGGVIGAAYTLYTIIEMVIGAEERSEKLAEAESKIDRSVAEFDSKLQNLSLKTGISVPRLNRKPVVGELRWNMFYTEKRSFPWRNYDLFGDTILTYLEYRAANPDVMYSGGDELVVLSKLHMNYFSPGVPFCLPREGMGFDMIVTNNLYGDELSEFKRVVGKASRERWADNSTHHALEIGRGDWGEADFLNIYTNFSKFRIERHRAEFKVAVRAFLEAHTKHSFVDLTQEGQDRVWEKMMNALPPGLRQYVFDVDSLSVYVTSLPTGNFTRPGDTRRELAAAVNSLRLRVVSIVTTHPESATGRLIAFEKTHGMALIYRGLEELTDVYGMDTWMFNGGRDLSQFETIFALGSFHFLTGASRSVDEQRSTNNLIEAQISRDNLDMVAFYAAGQKGQGDNETPSQFRARFVEWQRVTAKNARLHAMDRGGAPSHNVYTVSRSPGGGDPSVFPVNTQVPDIVDVNHVTCAYVPRSKRKASSLVDGSGGVAL